MFGVHRISSRIALISLLGGLASAQDAATLYREGLKYFSARQPQQAAAALQQSLALDPSNAAGWKALGVVFASQGDYERAEPALRNACERQPKLEDACLYHGRSLYLLDRFLPALETLRNAMKVSPDAEAHRLAGLSLEALGRSAEAETEFRSALKLPHRGAADEDPGIDFGVFLYRQGRTEESVPPLRAAVERHPDSSRAHLELGCVWLALDRLEDAARELERSLVLRDSARGHLLLGKAYLRMGKPDAAEPHIKR
jgi:tetratricopeptide (TPR) repeat protein